MKTLKNPVVSDQPRKLSGVIRMLVILLWLITNHYPPTTCLAAGVSTNKVLVLGTNNVLPPNETNFFQVNSNLLNASVAGGGGGGGGSGSIFNPANFITNGSSQVDLGSAVALAGSLTVPGPLIVGPGTPDIILTNTALGALIYDLGPGGEFDLDWNFNGVLGWALQGNSSLFQLQDSSGANLPLCITKTNDTITFGGNGIFPSNLTVNGSGTSISAAQDIQAGRTLYGVNAHISGTATVLNANVSGALAANQATFTNGQTVTAGGTTNSGLGFFGSLYGNAATATLASYVNGILTNSISGNAATATVASYVSGVLTNSISGSAAFLTTALTNWLNATYQASSTILSNIVNASGTPGATTYLRGDWSWQVPPGGGGSTFSFNATQFSGSGGTTNIKSGASLTNLSAAGLTDTAGTTNSGLGFFGGGAGLTGLNASALSSGFAPIAVLTNVWFYLTNTAPATPGYLLQYESAGLQWINTNTFLSTAQGTVMSNALALLQTGSSVLSNVAAATGTPSGTTYLRGDWSWATPPGGGGGIATLNGIGTNTYLTNATTSGETATNFNAQGLATFFGGISNVVAYFQSNVTTLAWGKFTTNSHWEWVDEYGSIYRSQPTNVLSVVGTNGTTFLYSNGNLFISNNGPGSAAFTATNTFSSQVQSSNGWTYVDTNKATMSLTNGFLNLNGGNPVMIADLSSALFVGGAFIRVVGHYAYMTADSTWEEGNADSDALNIIDIQNPANPTLVSSITTTNIKGAEGLAVEGNYAYVCGSSSNKVSVFDISNPAVPKEISWVSNATVLNYAAECMVAGPYLYVYAPGKNFNVGEFSIWNRSNPTNLVLMSSLTDARIVGGAFVEKRGKYAYVSSTGNAPASNCLALIDVSNPYAPTIAGSSATITGGCYSCAAYDKYAAVISFNANTVSILDLSDPTNTPYPIVGTISLGTSGDFLTTPKVAGRCLVVGQTSTSSLFIVDLGNPTSPQLVGQLVDPTDFLDIDEITLAGNYAYITGYSSGAGHFLVCQLPGLCTSTANIGSMAADELTVGGRSMLGDVIIRDKLSAGSAISCDGSLSTALTCWAGSYSNLANTFWVDASGNMTAAGAATLNALNASGAANFCGGNSSNAFTFQTNLFVWGSNYISGTGFANNLYVSNNISAASYTLGGSTITSWPGGAGGATNGIQMLNGTGTNTYLTNAATSGETATNLTVRGNMAVDSLVVYDPGGPHHLQSWNSSGTVSFVDSGGGYNIAGAGLFSGPGASLSGAANFCGGNSSNAFTFQTNVFNWGSNYISGADFANNSYVSNNITIAGGLIMGSSATNNITNNLPIASTTIPGAVKVDGSTITINGSGVISATGSGSWSGTISSGMTNSGTQGITNAGPLTNAGNIVMGANAGLVMGAVSNNPVVSNYVTVTYITNSTSGVIISNIEPSVKTGVWLLSVSVASAEVGWTSGWNTNYLDAGQYLIKFLGTNTASAPYQINHTSTLGGTTIGFAESTGSSPQPYFVVSATGLSSTNTFRVVACVQEVFSPLP